MSGVKSQGTGRRPGHAQVNALSGGVHTTWIRGAVCALSVALPLLSAASVHAKPASKLKTDKDRTLYALGVAVGQNLGKINLSADELLIVQQGLADSAMKREPKVSMAEFGPKIQQLAQERMAAAAAGEKAETAKLLKEEAAKKGALRKESGLIISMLIPGTGKSPKATDKVKVHYHGTLRDGTVFDSSVNRGEPATFPLNGVIPCWTEGLQLMKVGGRSRLVCPSDMAYGDQGRPGIPPGAALIFVVELLSIEESDSP